MSSKPCKYECGILIQWDKAKSIFVELDGTPHTKERCGSLKEKKKPVVAPELDGVKELAAAIRELTAAIRSRPI